MAKRKADKRTATRRKDIREKLAQKKLKPDCAKGVCNPRRVQGLKAKPKKGKHALIKLEGPGVFLGGIVTKQGGTSGLTFPSLDIDGRNVVNLSFAAASNWGLSEQNPFGLVLLGSGSLQSMTMGFPTPLRFEKSLKLSVSVNEPGVVQIVANVVVGKA